MGAIGWGVVPVLLVRLVLVALMGAAWFVLAPGTSGSGAPAGAPGRPASAPPAFAPFAWAPFAWARLIRDSASECLPLSQLGGFVLGARALTIGLPFGRAAPRAGGAFAAASTVVDVTLELVAQLLYLAGGLALLHAVRPHLPLVGSLTEGAGALGAAVAAFLLLQRRGALLVERAATRVLRRWTGLAQRTAQALRSLAAIHASRRRLAAGIVLHLAAWIGNGLEAWLILSLMGHAIPVRAALIIDSLLYGLRSFAFMVPNALGVQETGYVVLGGLFGLDMQTCLALSLLRRARDLLLGVPALAAWQLTEGRRLTERAGRNAAFGDRAAHRVQ